MSLNNPRYQRAFVVALLTALIAAAILIVSKAGGVENAAANAPATAPVDARSWDVAVSRGKTAGAVDDFAPLKARFGPAEHGDLGLRIADAFTEQTTSGETVTVVPGSGGACVVVSSGALCGHTKTLSKVGAAVSWSTPPIKTVGKVSEGELPIAPIAQPTSGDVVIEGIAVDAVDRVEVVSADGSVLTDTKVEGSTFSLKAPVTDRPSELRIIRADGARSIIGIG